MSQPAPWPVDKVGLPTKDYLNTLDTKEKWENFMKTADEKSQLHRFIHWNNLAYGEPEHLKVVKEGVTKYAGGRR
jgi:hypothetical protein